ncbi:hypothetical protein ACTGJ9_033060 [Bradyrhizobium sp. RDM12]
MQFAKSLLAALTLVGMVAPPARAELDKVGRTGLVALYKNGDGPTISEFGGPACR